MVDFVRIIGRVSNHVPSVSYRYAALQPHQTCRKLPSECGHLITMASENPQNSMFSFRLLSNTVTSGQTARIGRLVSGNVQIDTPGFIAPSSRGVVPHLSHDNLRDHTNIRVVEKGFPKSPIFEQSSGSLRKFASHPEGSLLILGARRSPPVETAAANSDHSIAILTSTGFTELNVNDYISAVSTLRPDAAISVPDIPTHVAGKNRRPKMIFRVEKWLDTLLKNPGAPVIAAVPPVDLDEQNLYIDMLSDRKEEISGLALYDSTHALQLPEGLNKTLRLSMDDSLNPHKILQDISGGIDIFNLPLLNTTTDSGIALDFVFPSEKLSDSVLKPLGRDMWDKVFAVDVSPLVEGCSCYACTKHHRAYVQHLLSAKEMTAWVLLQIHNSHTLDQFFKAIYSSISKGTFEEDRQKFSEAYEPELPQKTGEGPRMRGYQSKPTPGPKMNKKAYEKFKQNDKLQSDEALVPDSDTAILEKGGFAERLSG